MSLVALSSAFLAGVFTFFSPCSFPMLPAYLTFYLGIDENQENYAKTLKKGLKNGLISTFAFIVIFSAMGLLVSSFSSVISPYLRYAEPIIGFILIALGIAFLLNLGVTLRVRVSPTSPKIFSFSVLYALASMGCALPVFLSMVLFSLMSGGFFEAMLVFLTYALGMGTMMITINVLIAGTKRAVIDKIRRAMPVIRTAGGVLLIAIGGYLVYYYYTIWVF